MQVFTVKVTHAHTHTHARTNTQTHARTHTNARTHTHISPKIHITSYVESSIVIIITLYLIYCNYSFENFMENLFMAIYEAHWVKAHRFFLKYIFQIWMHRSVMVNYMCASKINACFNGCDTYWTKNCSNPQKNNTSLKSQTHKECRNLCLVHVD